MAQRTALATVAAATLTLFTGAVALGATAGLFTGGVTDAPTRPVVTRQPETRGAVVPATLSLEPERTDGAAKFHPVAPGAASLDGAPPPASPPTPDAGAVASSTAPAPEHEGTSPSIAPAPPSTSPTLAPTPTTTRPPGCAGSDDGLTAAQQQAREAACHGGHDDD